MKDDVQGREQEQGFLLLGLIVAIFIILLTLSVAAPKMARELRREREVETVHRGNQYVRAIQLYYRKFGHYPGSMEQLDKTNMIRFLRQDYVDPMTGKVDWRIIKVGENKTTVKGFFGKPLAGLPTAGLGSAAGMASSFGSSGTAPGAASQGSAFGNSGSIGSPLGGSSSPTSGMGTSGPGTSSPSGSNTTDNSTGSSSGGTQSTSASSFTGASGPFLGVGLVKDGDSIITLNEQTTYNTWEFIYDPRIEQLKAKAAMMGGGATGFGSSSGSGSSSGFGSSSPFGSGTGFGNSTPTSNGNGTSGSGTNGSTGTTPSTNSNPQ
ncbi:type II secretion system protein [Edaphobacter sp.]|uniref:type II secretion system protein n=1 Tax=Edaphobacter sp. TaxID=1934404 RepID=UPI002DBFE9AD|nr:type II secretion system protein [Edaphobacter sp.]HEU5339913.1 type II secretion system protein [Edaphobacter sp.]